MDLAQDDLNHAHLDIKEGFYRQAIVSAYYVVLSSSRALLLEKGYLPKSHAGVFTMLGLHLMKHNILPKTYSNKIKKVFRKRLDANYNAQRDFSRTEAQETIDFAEEFYQNVKSLL